MNKEQCEKLIDKLANKELSFGCRVRIKRKASCHPECSIYTNGTIVSRKQKGVYHVVYSNNKDVILNDTEWSKVLGHPVLIGDVLEKMWKFGDASLRSNEMFKIWAKCGLDKSLNQIAECGFEEIYITNCCKLSGYHKNKDGSYSCAHCNKPANLNMHEEQLKDPAARELFEFLADIFLT